MSEVVIKTEEKKEEPKAEVHDLKKQLEASEEYQATLKENEQLKKSIIELKEKEANFYLGGKAAAGQVEENEEEKAKKEAADILSKYT